MKTKKKISINEHKRHIIQYPIDESLTGNASTGNIIGNQKSSGTQHMCTVPGINLKNPETSHKKQL
jgi:hypothetical protein